MTAARILVVDDEPDLRWVLRGLFEDAGFAVEEAADGEAALAAVNAAVPDVVLTDVRMPQMQGTELLTHLRRSAPDLPVVLLSAVEDIATAVEAIKLGAFDYQAKPYDPQRLLLTIRRAAEQHALRRELLALRTAAFVDTVDFGPSPAAQDLRRTIELVAAQPSVAVLLVGESGTGKEVVAREIHRRSARNQSPFVAIDCGALPESLMESQLFGHKRGAFTGADRDRPGLFQMAHGGTLFLDELGNLPLALQAKLLRALQERAVIPVGGSEAIAFQTRLICATNVAIDAEVRNGRFRVDLYHRIAEFTLPLPPLRTRPDDVVHFARRFLAAANQELGREVRGMSTRAEHYLQHQPWPGNLRELRNEIRRAVLLCADTELDVDDFQAATPAEGDPGRPAPPPSANGIQPDSDLPLAEQIRLASDRLEAQILQQTLVATAGNKAQAARLLQIDYTTLHRKLKRHGLLG